jgi:hypothetical protein
VRAERDLLAALTWQPMPPGFPDRLYAALPPAGSDESSDVSSNESLTALLQRACHDLASWRTTLALEFPGGEYADAIQSAGFHLHRTLIWMQLLETPPGESRT